MTAPLAPAGPTPPPLVLARLTLANFRNYPTLRLALGPEPVVLWGENGAGKTNLLEAVSLLAPGRGLRQARLDELDRISGGRWALAARLDGVHGAIEVESAHEPDQTRRSVRIDGKAVRGSGALASTGGILWLTPAQDRLFVDAPAGRRRFVDRLVLLVDPEHAGRVAVYERTLRERSLLLRESRADPAWLTALEVRLAATGVAISAARREVVAAVQRAILAAPSPFPAPRLELAGEIETWLDRLPAAAAEEHFAAALAAARASDAATGGASLGPHRSDLRVVDAATGEPAEGCSTGRQKSLLIRLVLAAAVIAAEQRGELPILLLDEIAAHLDARRRAELADVLLGLGAQAWLSGTERELFAPLAGRAQLLHIQAATVQLYE